MPVCLVDALAALLTANVSAGPELPIRAVIVEAFAFSRPPRATPAVSASAATMTATSDARQRAGRVIRCTFTAGSSFELATTPGVGRVLRRSAPILEALSE